jgi:hypothetical protein
VRGVLGLGGGGLFRLGGDQRGRDADHDERRHGDIACAPGRALGEPEAFEAAHQEKGAGGRGQHADAISRDVGGHTGGLLAFRQALDAESVDDDVLRGGRRRHQQRAQRDQPRRAYRIAEGKQYNRRDQQELREQEPATAPPEQGGQHRHVERIDHRRP